MRREPDCHSLQSLVGSTAAANGLMTAQLLQVAEGTLNINYIIFLWIPWRAGLLGLSCTEC